MQSYQQELHLLLLMCAFPFGVAEHDDGLVVILQAVVAETYHVKAVLAQEGAHLYGGTRYPATVQDFDIALVGAFFLHDDLLFFAARKQQNAYCQRGKNERAQSLSKDVVTW